MPQKETKTKYSLKPKFKQSPNEKFLAKSRATALQQSKLHMQKQQNKSFFRINEEDMIKSPTIEVITLTSNSTQNNPIKLYTSDKYNSMVTSPNSPDIPTNFTSTISTPKMDKAVKKIQKLNATPMTSNFPIENNAIPYGSTHIEQTAPNSAKTSEISTDNIQAMNPNAETNKKQNKEDKPTESQEDDPNEEHFTASASPGKSSVSDIKPSDFYDEELQD